MSITREEIQHLATLSNFSMSDEEIEDMKKDLASIIDYISQLDELDVEGVEPTYQVFDIENAWREDTIEEQDVTPKQLLNLTKNTENHQIKIPKVL